MTKLINTTGAMSGFRVLDFTTAWAGPRMAEFIAQMGAEVIHVESIQYLDTHRGWSKWAWGASGNMPNNEPGKRPWERNSQYNEFNKNKLGITLNLADPQGVALYKELVKISDVVIDNYKAGTTQRFGVDYPALKAIKPDLVVVSAPAFGHNGPYRNYTAWGNQIMALSGFGLMMNYEGDDEPEPGGTYADPVAAITGAFAIAAALLHRRRTGEGQFIELALSDVMPGMLPEPFAEYALNQRIPAATGNRNPDASPWNVYRCAGEDDWVAICCTNDADFAALCVVINKPELLDNPDFATVQARVANNSALDAIIEAWTITQDKHQAADMLQAAGVAAEACYELIEALHDPQLAARGFFNELTHEECGTYLHPLQAVKLSKTPPVDHSAAPVYGQHNTPVLKELLGLTDADLAKLTETLVIGDEPLEDDVRRKLGRSAVSG